MESKEKQNMNSVLLMALLLLIIIQIVEILTTNNIMLPEVVRNNSFVKNIIYTKNIYVFKVIYLFLVPGLFRIYILVDIAKKVKKEEQKNYRFSYYILSIFILIGAVSSPYFYYYNFIIYPVLMLSHIFVGSRGFAKISANLDEEDPLKNVSQKPLKEMGLIYPTDKGPLHVHNVFQGIMVQGGAGAGKSASIIEPAIKQWVEQSMSMTIYDFKGNPPTLGRTAYNAWLQTKDVVTKETVLRDRLNGYRLSVNSFIEDVDSNLELLDEDDVDISEISELSLSLDIKLVVTDLKGKDSSINVEKVLNDILSNINLYNHALEKSDLYVCNELANTIKTEVEYLLTLIDGIISNMKVELKRPVFNLLSIDQLEISVRPNPLRPQDITSSIQTRSITDTLLLTLNKEWVTKKDFWANSAISLCWAIAERLRKDKKYHSFCTIPHLVYLATADDSNALIDWLADDFEIKNIISSFITAKENNADQQIAGMIASLQQPLSSLISPEIFYLFGAEPKDQSSLDLNDLSNPQILTIANNPKIQTALSPILSCCIRSIINQVNEQGKHPHAMVLDELPTIYIQDLSSLPATGRSNKISTMIGIQDESQLQKQYDKEADEVIANMGNQFIGMTNNAKTAKKYSDFFGTYQKKATSYSTSDNSLSLSDSLKNEKLLQDKDIANQSVGHFVGKISDGDPAFFSVQCDEFKIKDHFPNWKNSIELPWQDPVLDNIRKENMKYAKIIFKEMVELNYHRIINECNLILEPYKENHFSNDDDEY